MSATFSKTVLVLLLCLAFVGQTMAATVMSYEMMSMNAMSTPLMSHDMSMMDHSTHLMDMNESAGNTADSADQSCCSKSCHCVVGNCSAVAVLVEISHDNFIANSLALITFVSLLQNTPIPSSLFRPPIVS